MKKNNSNALTIYRERSELYRILLAGIFCISYGIDNLTTGKTRLFIGKYLVLKDFGASARETFLTYVILGIGIFCILYFVTNFKTPLIVVNDQTITLRSHKRFNSVNKPRKDYVFYEFIDESIINFFFKDEAISVNIDSVKKEMLEELLGEL
tara:strand:- start:43 stop:498 length:456 start_codon:yes stop_codon:yes gene_type:complete